MRVVVVASTVIHDDISVSGYRLHDRRLAAVGRDGAAVGDVLPSPVDELAEAAGRCCYQSWSRPNPATATNMAYLGNILDSAHFSVLEHGHVTFYVDGVSRSLLVELERHRFLSFSVVSQRFVDESGARFLKPPDVLDDEWDDVGEYLAGVREGYGDLYNNLTARGLPRKRARSAARAVLPGATEVKMFVTGNIRTWREIIQKRSDPNADEEIQLFAKAVYARLAKLAPHSVQDLSMEEK